jgi:hypothetical protein
MDHEYSLSGKVWTKHQEDVPPKCEINGLDFTLLPMGELSEYSVAPLNKDKVASLSDEDVMVVCREFSLKFQSRVRLCKLHEEYGLLNVFNGGSDYEVVASDCFTCEYDNGTLVSQKKESR